MIPEQQITHSVLVRTTPTPTTHSAAEWGMEYHPVGSAVGGEDDGKYTNDLMRCAHSAHGNLFLQPMHFFLARCFPSHESDGFIFNTKMQDQSLTGGN